MVKWLALRPPVCAFTLAAQKPGDLIVTLPDVRIVVAVDALAESSIGAVGRFQSLGR